MSADDAGPMDGAGVGESLFSASQHLDDPGLLALDGVAVGLDLLGVVVNPLGALASAGVGFLIEHVDFLHEALDDLAGDPAAVASVAALWNESVRSDLTTSTTDLQTSLSAVRTTWSGEAAEAYELVARNVLSMMDGLQAACGGISSAVQGSGVLVATARSLIRDIVADVVGEFIAAAIAALASSWFTLGGSMAAFVGWAVARGAAVAGKITSEVGKLVEKLSEVLRRFSSLVDAADDVQRLARRLDGIAGDLGRWVGRNGRGLQMRQTEGAVDELNSLLRTNILRGHSPSDSTLDLFDRVTTATGSGTGGFVPGVNGSGAGFQGALDSGNVNESQNDKYDEASQ